MHILIAATVVALQRGTRVLTVSSAALFCIRFIRATIKVLSQRKRIKTGTSPSAASPSAAAAAAAAAATATVAVWGKTSVGHAHLSPRSTISSSPFFLNVRRILHITLEGDLWTPFATAAASFAFVFARNAARDYCVPSASNHITTHAHSEAHRPDPMARRGTGGCDDGRKEQGHEKGSELTLGNSEIAARPRLIEQANSAPSNISCRQRDTEPDNTDLGAEGDGAERRSWLEEGLTFMSRSSSVPFYAAALSYFVVFRWIEGFSHSATERRRDLAFLLLGSCLLSLSLFLSTSLA